MTTTGKDFNAIAAQWDDKPQRLELAAAVARAIAQMVPLDPRMEALDFGCGTGLVSFHLIRHLSKVVAVDSAEKMLERVRDKALAAGVDAIETVHCDAEGIAALGRKFHLVYSSMVLHHVRDLEPLVAGLVAALEPGGYLALADLDAEDGLFHDEPMGVEHHGIDRNGLCRLLYNFGLTEIDVCTAHTIVKQRDGRSCPYPVFLVRGRKPL